MAVPNLCYIYEIPNCFVMKPNSIEPTVLYGRNKYPQFLKISGAASSPKIYALKTQRPVRQISQVLHLFQILLTSNIFLFVAGAQHSV